MNRALLGVVTLEDALLAVDPVGQTTGAGRSGAALTDNQHKQPRRPLPGRGSAPSDTQGAGSMTPRKVLDPFAPWLNQEPERDCMPDGDDAIVHYAPGEHPLCGTQRA